MSPTGKSFRSFVRACVRAKLRVPARRCCFRGWAISRKESSGARRGVPFPVAVLAVASRRFPSLLSGFSLLPVASRCFPWLPVASRCFPCAFSLRISANLCVWTLVWLVSLARVWTLVWLVSACRALRSLPLVSPCLLVASRRF